MKFFTRLAPLLFLALALLCDLSRPRTSVEVLPGAETSPDDQHRVRYPSAHLPVLILPGGQRRRVSSVLNVTRQLQFGDYVWNDDQIPAGQVWVRIDLDRQIMSVFRGGDEIGSAVVLFGTDGKQTPLGTFPVLEKAEQHRSSLYDAAMPYMLRLTTDGVAIHASDVRMGSATHGCIGVPAGFARLLFAQIRRGDPVAILRSSTASESTG